MRRAGVGWWIRAAALAVTSALPACGGGSAGGDTPGGAAGSDASSLAAAGAALFFDESLSASGRQSCATCHVPARAFTADPATDHGLSVPLGGADVDLNDLPVRYDANVNIGEVPYTPPSAAGGQAPTLTSDDIDDIVAFLCTLTDGYDPKNPAAYSWPAQCRAVESGSASP